MNERDNAKKDNAFANIVGHAICYYRKQKNGNKSEVRQSNYLEHGKIKWRGRKQVLYQVGKVVQLPLRQFSTQFEMILYTELDGHLRMRTSDVIFPYALR